MKRKIGASTLSVLLFIPVLIGLISPSVSCASESQSHSLQITAIVPPRPIDFQFELVEDELSGTKNDDFLYYKLIYGSYKSAAFETDNIITVSWNEDMSYLFEDFEFGASSSENQTATLKKSFTKNGTSITWTQKLQNGTTDQVIYLKFRKNANYTPLPNSAFLVTASMKNQYLKLPNQTITKLQLTYPFTYTDTTPDISYADLQTSPSSVNYNRYLSYRL